MKKYLFFNGCREGGKRVKKLKLKNVRSVIGYSLLFFFMFGTTVFADPKIVTGTKKLLTDAGKWMTGLAAAATVAIAVFHGLKWQAAGKEEKSVEAKAVKNTIIIGVIITCLSGIVTLVFSYYK